jgi:hypothetical protein
MESFINDPFLLRGIGGALIRRFQQESIEDEDEDEDKEMRELIMTNLNLVPWIALNKKIWKRILLADRLQ